MICDVSKWQGEIDWDKLAPCLEDGFVIIKASGKAADPQYARNAEGAVSHGVPFHVFHFLYCRTEAEARRDAGLFFRTVQRAGHWPLFWALDCEAGWGIASGRARPVAEAFEAELRRLARKGGAGEIRVAIYVAQQKYYDYALDYDAYEYVWIPGYGEKHRPTMPCDLWQYTRQGSLPGIKGNVDLDVLTGSKPMSFFTGATDESDYRGGDTMATVYIGGASIDENGKAHGGQAGNQTGKELKKQKWYLHKKGWRVFRAKSAAAQAKLAACMAAAVANRHIGYDQYQRNTLYAEAAKFGFDVSKVEKDVECDCSALVRVCCAYAGILGLPEGFRTTNEPKNLLATGAFTEMAGEKYTKQAAYLKAGDILCTPVQGHTVIVLNDGAKAEPTAEGLRRGDYGTAVRAMQEALLKWVDKCLPKYGADGDFGKETEDAVKAFQIANDLPATGVYDEATRAKLTGVEPAPAAQQVEVTGGSVNVRSGPGASGTRILGTAHKGDRLPWQGESRFTGGYDWYLVEFKGQNGWISGKYSRVGV